MLKFINALFDKEQKRKAIKLLVISTIYALMEATGVGAIVPFVTLLKNPEGLQAIPAWNYIVVHIGNRDTNELIAITGSILLGTFLLKNLLALIQFKNLFNFTQSFYSKLSSRLLAGYMYQPYHFFINANSAILAKNVTMETRLVAEQIIEPGLLLFSEFLVLFSIMTILFIYNFKVSLIVTLIVTAVFGGMYLFSNKFTRLLGAKREKFYAQMSKICYEALTGIKDIKVSGTDKYFYDKYSVIMDKLASFSALTSTLLQAPKVVIESTIVAIILGLIIFLQLTGNSTDNLISTLSLYLIAAYRLMPSANRIISSIMRLRYIEAGFRVIAPTLYEMVNFNVYFSKKHINPLNFTSAIRLKNIMYKYPNTKKNVLKNINLTINKGLRIWNVKVYNNIQSNCFKEFRDFHYQYQVD